MKIEYILGKPSIRYGNSVLQSSTEERVIKFYKECIKQDEKYKNDKLIKKIIMELQQCQH